MVTADIRARANALYWMLCMHWLLWRSNDPEVSAPSLPLHGCLDPGRGGCCWPQVTQPVSGGGPCCTADLTQKQACFPALYLFSTRRVFWRNNPKLLLFLTPGAVMEFTAEWRTAGDQQLSAGQGAGLRGTRLKVLRTFYLIWEGFFFLINCYCYRIKKNKSRKISGH